jgi:hypothetical protein
MLWWHDDESETGLSPVAPDFPTWVDEKLNGL